MNAFRTERLMNSFMNEFMNALNFIQNASKGEQNEGSLIMAAVAAARMRGSAPVFIEGRRR